MDEEKRPETAAAKAGERKKKRKKRVGRIVTVAVTVLLVAAAVLAFIYRDYLSAEGLRTLFGRTVTEQSGAEPFTYENGAEQTFAAAGDGLAVASSSAIQLLDSGGNTVAKRILSMDKPAVAASKVNAVFADIGGSACEVLDFSGGCTDIDAGDSIVSVSAGDSGCFAVISEEAGSKGLVRVYGADCKLLYEWYSGTGYALRAQVSPDGKGLAVLCAASTGSELHIFKLSSDQEQASASFDGKLLFDLAYMDADTLCAVGSDGLYFVGTDGKAGPTYDFGGKYLQLYDLGGSGFAAVYLSEYRAGSGGTIVTVDAGGNVLGSADTQGDAVSLSACGTRVLAAAASGLTLYSFDMQTVWSRDMLFTAQRALLREKGDALLLSGYSAEQLTFG